MLNAVQRAPTRARLEMDVPLAWEGPFLENLAKSDNATASAKLVGITPSVAYKHRAANERFAKLWEEARQEANDALIAEARRRAIEGTADPIFQGGVHVGDRIVYSDTMLTILLKANMPDRFTERFTIRLDSADIQLLDGLGIPIQKAWEKFKEHLIREVNAQRLALAEADDEQLLLPRNVTPGTDEDDE